MSEPAASTWPYSRRNFVKRLSACAAGLPFLAGPAWAQSAMLDATPLLAGTSGDVSAALQNAIDAAAARRVRLLLPGGRFEVSTLTLPSSLEIIGVAGATRLVLTGNGPIMQIGASDVTLTGLAFEGLDPAGNYDGLLQVTGATGVSIQGCRFSNSVRNGITIEDAAVRVEGCDFDGCAHAGIFSMNSRGIIAAGNRISGSGNGGILIWRSENGRDGSIITGNRIADTKWRGGGNGQNGNGINIYRADEVIVSGNHIVNSGFTAVRANSTNNTQISGNTCINSGEVAIFSEFAFTGSLIADNIVDGAATGIAITNFNDGGRLAVCSGNIIRNIFPRSEVNPDTRPIGIFAEADTALTGNVVEAVPGQGIVAGWGPYLRNVLVSQNVVRDADVGIAASVAEGAGQVRISGNLISDVRRAAIAGFAWQDMVSADLASESGKFPNLAVEGNSIS